MNEKFEVNLTKIKGGCQSYKKDAPQQSWSDITLSSQVFFQKIFVNFKKMKYMHDINNLDRISTIV